MPIAIAPTIKVDRWEEEVIDYNTKEKLLKSKQSILTEVVTKYLLIHTSGETLEVSGYWQGVDTQDKWAGKATTYALKNTLLNMFLVPTWVDTDDTHSDDLPTPPRKKEKPNWEILPDDDNKEWFNEENWEKFKLVDHNFESPSEAPVKARKYYKVSKAWASKIEHYYKTGEDNSLDSFK